MSIQNRLSSVRQSRGASASDLAKRVGVSRQTIYAIEAGSYVPNTTVALQLARELEVTVEDLFSLAGDSEPRLETVPAAVISASPVRKGSPVRLCCVGDSWVGVPVSSSPYFLTQADGVVARSRQALSKTDVQVVGADESLRKRLIVAGCDPAIGLLAHLVERLSGVEVIAAPAASRLALNWLKEGKVHVAGAHLEDAETGEFNLPYLREHFGGERLTVVTFARWEEGFVVRRGNPKKIRGAGDLGRRAVRLINREPGSGSRALLDKLLRDAGVQPRFVNGYQTVAAGHLAAAQAVASGDADCCVATPSAALAYALDFVPLREERFDLVLRKESLDSPAVRSMLDVLQTALLRRKLETLAGYDTSKTGDVVG